jgi:hypothetical protein
VRAATTSFLLAAALLAGCAAMTESECRTTNWQALGELDGGAYGMRPRIDLLTQQCRAYNVTPAEAEYMAGWAYGYAEYQRRVVGSECCR